MLIHNPQVLNQFEVPKSEDSHLKTYYLYFLWYENILVYIGQTVDLNSRTIAHKKDKYFDKVTYQVFIGVTKPEILKIEREHINHFKPPYNDNEKGIIKTKTCALQRGKTIYQINKLYTYRNQAFYYDGKVLQSIIAHYKGYFYCEDGKQITKIRENSVHLVRDFFFFIEDGKLKCKFEDKKEEKKKDDITNKKLKFIKGKYKGRLFEDISRIDTNYINWMKNTIPNYMSTMMK